MENNSIDVSKENWMSVPAFGDWEKLQGMMPDYSMDFSKIREIRKQSKSEYSSRMSISSNEAGLFSKSNAAPDDLPHPHPPPPPIIHQSRISLGRKTFMSYFACCGTKISS